MSNRLSTWVGKRPDFSILAYSCPINLWTTNLCTSDKLRIRCRYHVDKGVNNLWTTGYVSERHSLYSFISPHIFYPL